jgi:hypothetical protein
LPVGKVRYQLLVSISCEGSDPLAVRPVAVGTAPAVAVTPPEVRASEPSVPLLADSAEPESLLLLESLLLELLLELLLPESLLLESLLLESLLEPEPPLELESLPLLSESLLLGESLALPELPFDVESSSVAASPSDAEPWSVVESPADPLSSDPLLSASRSVPPSEVRGARLPAVSSLSASESWSRLSSSD